MKAIILATGGMLFAGSAVTAAAADTQQSNDVERIVVTANRTETLLSQTPLSMSVLSGKELVHAGITDPTALAIEVPSLSIVRNNGLQITIRGVTSSDNTEKGDPSAAFMLNGIYIARPQEQEVSFYDVERVEVLRGPQGTLYGRNSTAGVINVLSVKPKFVFGGSVDTSYGNFGDANTTAVINTPVSETVAVRLAVNSSKRDNYIIHKNATDGVTLDPFKDDLSGRLSVLFKPNSSFNALIVGDYSKMKGVYDYTVPTSNFYSNVNPGGSTFSTATHVDRSSSAYRTISTPYAQQSRRDNDNKGLMAELNFDAGFGKFTYLGSHRQFDRAEIQNFGTGAIMADFNAAYRENSHELRLVTDLGPVQLQSGMYYFRETSELQLSLFNLLGPNTGYQFLRNPTISENKSAFAQATYEAMPDLRLTFGARYSEDRKSRVGSSVQNNYSAVPNAYNLGTLLSSSTLETSSADRTFSKATWRAGFDYDTRLGLVYGSVATGYKAGGFNDGCEVGQGSGCSMTANALYYTPESLTAYEVGFKIRPAAWLQLNGSAFRYDYKDLQLSQSENICGPSGNLPCTVTRNAASATIDGIEMDAKAKLSQNFTLKLGINHLNARYDEYKPRPGVDLSGRKLDRSPGWTGEAGIIYSTAVGTGKLAANLSTRYSGSYELTDGGSLVFFNQPSFTKSDVSLTYSAARDAWYVSAFVKNIENKVTVTNATADGFNGVTFSDPRLYGVRAGLKF